MEPSMKRPSMRKAINEKCKECIYDPLSGLGTWRQQTEGCTSTDCPLYELRPRSGPKKQQNTPLEDEVRVEGGENA